MTNHDDIDIDEALLAYWEDDHPDDVEWYCNHDVPNGCRDCAWLRSEDEMLAAMTTRERNEYFAWQDETERLREMRGAF